MNPVKTISVDELKNELSNNNNLILIDVREPDEWHEIHIPQATLIPKDEIAIKIQSITTDKKVPIYLHCKSGMRSQIAAQTLIKQGYENVYSVNGGIIEWAQKGFDVKKSI